MFWMAQLNLSATEDPRTLFLPQYKGGKRHATVQVCLAGANLPVRGRKVGKKKKEELKETNSSLTHHMWFALDEIGQFCSCSSLLGLHPALLCLPEGGESAIVYAGFRWCEMMSSHCCVGENKQHKTKHAVPLLHLCKTCRHQSRCEWTLNKPNG